MGFEHKDNNGSVFENDRKNSAAHPDYRGSAKINGVDYWVSGWWKQSSRGADYMSLAFTRMEPREEEPPRPPTRRSTVQPRDNSSYGQRNYESKRISPKTNDFGDDFTDDDIPF